MQRASHGETPVPPQRKFSTCDDVAFLHGQWLIVQLLCKDINGP